MDPDKDHYHVCLISPRKTPYMDAYGWMCNHCQRRTLGKCYRHRCKEFAWNNCLACNRILKENVLIYKDTEKTYCDKLNLEKTIKKPTKKRKDKWRVLKPGGAPGHGVCCIECNMEIGSDFCWISHKANVCSRRVQCTQCKRLVYYNGTVPMKPPNGGKYMPGERKKILLELQHSICDDNNRFCRLCFTSHAKDEPCKMRFKKMSPQRSKICFVSHAVIATNFQAECHVCYTNNETCSIHDGLQSVT